MFDTMTLTKAAGALCGTLLVFLLGSWAAEMIYHVGGGGHGDHAKQAYVIEVESADTASAAATEEVPFAEILAAADVAKGGKVFGKCKACHKLGAGENGTGPTLYNVVGRAIGTEGGFAYSEALAGLGGDWTPERLSGFLENPKKYAAGTKMSFAGLKKVKDRANLIAYLAQNGG